MTDDDLFRVVFVCTGNRARSALAEALFLKHSEGLRATASSCGTLDVGPLPPLPAAVDAARRLEVDLSDHRARPLRAVDFTSADLVLGFEQTHVASAVVDGNADPASAFLLGEIVPLLGVHDCPGNPVARARAAVAAADMKRTRYRPSPSATLVGDPLGKSTRVMHRTAGEIDRLVGGLVVALFGRSS